MNVTVLGGSAAGPNAGAGSAGFLIQHGDTSIICDLGPGTLLEARKHVDVHSLSAVLITHYHLDHVADLGAFRYLLEYGPRRPEQRIPLHIPAYARQYLDKWSATFGHGERPDFFDSVFDVQPYDGSFHLSVGTVEVRFARTVHPVEGWAPRFSAGSGLDFGYTADTGPTADLAGHFAGVGLLASEATEVAAPTDEDIAARGHLTATEAGELATKAGAQVLLLTHLWQENGLDRAADHARTTFAGPVLLARPGLTVYL